MMAVPVATPVTTPAASTDATVTSEVVHVPPAVVLFNEVVALTQTAVAPVIAGTTGAPFTVIANVTVVVPHVPVTE